MHATRRASGDDAPTIAALQVLWLIHRIASGTCASATCLLQQYMHSCTCLRAILALIVTCCHALPVSLLQELQGAAERLRWFEANLAREGSFDAAVAGCK